MGPTVQVDDCKLCMTFIVKFWLDVHTLTMMMLPLSCPSPCIFYSQLPRYEGVHTCAIIIACYMIQILAGSLCTFYGF